MPVQTMQTKTTTGMKKACQVGKSSVKCMLKEQIKSSLRVQDETNFISRYKWKNLPFDFDGNFLERMLYFKYDLMAFVINGEHYLLPYTFNGDIDFLGRFKNVMPLPFINGKSEDEKHKIWLANYVKKVLYEIKEVDNPEDYCVILKDYTETLTQKPLPRAILNESILDYQAEIIAMHRTSLINSSGVEGIRVNDETEITEVENLNQKVQENALTGQKYVAVSSKIDMQNLDSHSAPNSQQFMTAYASIDNFRLSLMGVSNGGVQEKQGTIIQAEADAGKPNSKQILDNGLKCRERFAELYNYLHNTNIEVEINENAEEPISMLSNEIEPKESEENANSNNNNI